MNQFPNTNLLYLSDSSTSSTSEIIGIEETDYGPAIILDQTILYPQGGGQPCDLGSISNQRGTVALVSVRFDSGIVYHFTEETSVELTVGDKVELSVDADRRMINSKNHTAGHLIDTAMIYCGYNFRPTKGYHFPDSPYVEYEGMIEAEDRERVCKELETEVNKLIAAAVPVKSFIVEEYDQLKEHCTTVPEYVPKDKPIRVVNVGGVGCPCGGTHVSSLADLGHVSVHKIKVKSGNIRVGYRVDR